MIIHPLRRYALPSVAMGIATLIGYRMTSSHSSKDPLRPPVSGGQFLGAVLTVVTTPSHRGEGWGGVCSPSLKGGMGWVLLPPDGSLLIVACCGVFIRSKTNCQLSAVSVCRFPFSKVPFRFAIALAHQFRLRHFLAVQFYVASLFPLAKHVTQVTFLQAHLLP